jgi:hypothetical protein
MTAHPTSDLVGVEDLVGKPGDGEISESKEPNMGVTYVRARSQSRPQPE